ncbi:HAD-IIA family hydrolase [Halovenus sp. WSH3]|uniref:HAD-IIA family hydrolase n=1 Tax=Halovenus carboxidivorans TaxID=2692199 RepID=A0A6B0TCW0_9EURY|nr:HAD-IIA family hydrolase [Halovenus carboxidivorans]MXR53071.1 HAD-IIA family hydrolase [Halovenus carboxidivorans]
MTLRGAIVDLDGTVYRGGDLCAGTADGLDALRSAGLNILFFSNNPLKDGADYIDRLTDLGLDVSDCQACSSGVVTTEYLVDHHPDEQVFCIGADGLREQFRAASLAVTDEPTEADVLVASWTSEFDFGDMRDALAAADEDTPFLGTDPDRTFPMEGGTVVPGSGAIIGSVAAVLGRDPDAILGKPSETAQQAALDRLSVDPEECLVVGDRLDTDLRLGERAGMTTVLVLSGVSDREDIAASDIDPDYVIDSLGDIDTVLADAAASR